MRTAGSNRPRGELRAVTFTPESPVIHKKENRPEAADYGRSNPRNQRLIDFFAEHTHYLAARSELKTSTWQYPFLRDFGNESAAVGLHP